MLVISGPNINEDIIVTKISPGKILNIREIKNSIVDFLVIKLFVTSNPLIKKKIFTAMPPVLVWPNRFFIGSVKPHAGFIANE